MQNLSDDPSIYTINNYITLEECEHMINISKDKIAPSLVSGSKSGYISPGRTGQNCWISHDYDDITSKIAERISNQVGISLKNTEAFQVIYYDVDQEYKQHYDSWEFDNSERSIRNMKHGGQRMVTALVYLNDVEEGGGTKFTKLGKEVKAEKGKLLIFHNVINGTNIRHKLSEHAGMPVLKGEKWAFNLWFREQDKKLEYDYKEKTFDNNINYKLDYNYFSKKINNNNYKLTINDTWKNWVSNQIKKGVSLQSIENKLNKQNYSPYIIKNLLYNNNSLAIDSKELVKKIEIVDDQFPENYLEEGDFFPFIKLGYKQLHNIVNSKDILIIIISKIEKSVLNIIKNIEEYYNFYFLYSEIEEEEYLLNIGYFININTIPNILNNKKNTVYILDANRRIKNIKTFNNINDILNLKIEKKISYVNIPYLIIEDVLDEPLLKKVLDFYNNSNNQEIHNSSNKNRLHVHPNKELEKMIDNKLSRSLFPEIKKIFYFDVEYRELYKICSYNSETNGRFAAHRDTPYPHQHRKFALSLLLNDDYEGGELFLQEYNIQIKPKANTAIVFPGICSHQVNSIISGSRKTIITFFCTEKPDDAEANERNRVKSNFFIERKVENSLVYPF